MKNIVNNQELQQAINVLSEYIVEVTKGNYLAPEEKKALVKLLEIQVKRAGLALMEPLPKPPEDK